MIIFDPSCTNEEIEGEINKLSDIITHENGKVIEINRWGKKKLAYEIKKKNTGFFVVFQFVLSPEKIGKFKNYFKFNNLVLRYNLLKIELEGEMPFSSYENEDGGGKNNE
ncbi:MAG: 30S ribosomal protein S6 [Candidatus Cloacimonas sp. 4484_209]|nr:MAG: 30S ribosomal protein S6 [Candidatus Cloacimonas sp. 4484_209]